jgi:hypothetical protein
LSPTLSKSSSRLRGVFSSNSMAMTSSSLAVYILSVHVRRVRRWFGGRPVTDLGEVLGDVST